MRIHNFWTITQRKATSEMISKKGRYACGFCGMLGKFSWLFDSKCGLCNRLGRLGRLSGGRYLQKDAASYEKKKQA